MTKVIAVTNRKGGVGKSTLSVHIAAGLATMGYNVGLVDTDSQGHASFMLGVEDSNALYDLLVEKRPVNECAYHVPIEQYSTADTPARGTLHLIASHERTATIASALEPGDIYAFMFAMDEFIAEYDLHCVIVDTSPSITEFTVNVYMGIDKFLIVTELEALSFKGLQHLVAQVNRFKRNREMIQRETGIMAVVPNKMREVVNVHSANAQYLADAFGAQMWNPLSLRIAWVEAAQLQQTIFTYKPSGIESGQMWHLVKRVAKEVKAWRIAKAK